MLIVGGIWGAIVGITAIAEDEFFVVTPDWVFQFDATAWGWTHLIVGVAFVASGIGIFSGNVLARTVGVVVAGLGIVFLISIVMYAIINDSDGEDTPSPGSTPTEPAPEEPAPEEPAPEEPAPEAPAPEAPAEGG